MRCACQIDEEIPAYNELCVCEEAALNWLISGHTLPSASRSQVDKHAAACTRHTALHTPCHTVFRSYSIRTQHTIHSTAQHTARHTSYTARHSTAQHLMGHSQPHSTGRMELKQRKYVIKHQSQVILWFKQTAIPSYNDPENLSTFFIELHVCSLSSFWSVNHTRNIYNGSQ